VRAGANVRPNEKHRAWARSLKTQQCRRGRRCSRRARIRTEKPKLIPSNGRAPTGVQELRYP
jgi:hypothetical protein